MGNAKRCVATPACSGRKHVMRTCVRGRTIVSDRVNSTGTSDHPRTCAYPACGGARHHLRHRRKAVKVNPPRNAGFVAGCCMPFQRSAPFCESGWLPLSDSQTQTHGLPGEMQAVSKSKDRLRARLRFMPIRRKQGRAISWPGPQQPATKPAFCETAAPTMLFFGSRRAQTTRCEPATGGQTFYRTARWAVRVVETTRRGSSSGCAALYASIVAASSTSGRRLPVGFASSSNVTPAPSTASGAAR